MTAAVIAHPHWVQRSGGIAEVDQYFRARGYDTVFVEGSQYLHVMEPTPVRPPPTETVRLYAPLWAWWPNS